MIHPHLAGDTLIAARPGEPGQSRQVLRLDLKTTLAMVSGMVGENTTMIALPHPGMVGMTARHLEGDMRMTTDLHLDGMEETTSPRLEEEPATTVALLLGGPTATFSEIGTGRTGRTGVRSDTAMILLLVGDTKTIRHPDEVRVRLPPDVDVRTTRLHDGSSGSFHHICTGRRIIVLCMHNDGITICF